MLTNSYLRLTVGFGGLVAVLLQAFRRIHADGFISVFSMSVENLILLGLVALFLGVLKSSLPTVAFIVGAGAAAFYIAAQSPYVLLLAVVALSYSLGAFLFKLLLRAVAVHRKLAAISALASVLGLPAIGVSAPTPSDYTRLPGINSVSTLYQK